MHRYMCIAPRTATPSAPITWPSGLLVSAYDARAYSDSNVINLLESLKMTTLHDIGVVVTAKDMAK